jgi:hypothetical protein
MSINDATPQDWDRVRETGQPTFDEYMKRLNSSWVHDGTSPAAQIAYKEDVDLFGDCWPDEGGSRIDESLMKVYLDRAKTELEKPDPEADMVCRPSHYNTGNIECIEAIEESMSSVAFKGYLKGNCMKYLWRYDYKGKQVEDLEKAGWYLRRLTAVVTEENS